MYQIIPPTLLVERSCGVFNSLKKKKKKKPAPICVDFFNYRFELLKIFPMSAAHVLQEFNVSFSRNHS